MRKRKSAPVVILVVVVMAVAVLLRAFRPQAVRPPDIPSVVAPIPHDEAGKLAQSAIEMAMQQLSNPQYGRHREVVRTVHPQHPDWYGEVNFTESVNNLNSHARIGGWHQRDVPPETVQLIGHGVAGASRCTIEAMATLLCDVGPVTGAYLDRTGQKSYVGELGAPLAPGQWFPVTLEADTPADSRIFKAIVNAMRDDPTFWVLNQRGRNTLSLEAHIATSGTPNTLDFGTHCITVTAIVYNPASNRFQPLATRYVGWFACPPGVHQYVQVNQLDWDSAAGALSTERVVASLTRAQFAFMQAANQILDENSRNPAARDTCPLHIVEMNAR